MNGSEYHLSFLARAIDDLPDAPCDDCRFCFECANPDWCEPYQNYIETGEKTSPPDQLPTGAN